MSRADNRQPAWHQQYSLTDMHPETIEIFIKDTTGSTVSAGDHRLEVCHGPRSTVYFP